MKFIMKLLAAALLIAVPLFKAGAGGPGINPPDSSELNKYLVNLPFSMPGIREPSFPDHRVTILDYGAIADGHTINTKAFSDAIRACAQAGGGTVVVPPGTWLTGPIKLENNINLHLERGALIQFSNRFEDFPLIAGFDGKSKHYQVTPPIFGYRLDNIAITGRGVIDGAGEAWRPVKKDKQTADQWKRLIASGGALSPDGKIWWPSKEASEGEYYMNRLEESGKTPTMDDVAKAREYLRPNLVQLVQCTGMLLDGPRFQNSPRFHIHPLQSENIIVRNVEIFSEWYAQNGDGLDLSSCRNVVVYNTNVSAGDDAICIKPGKIAKRQSPGPACENIVIADCMVRHGHGGFVIGSECSGGARNIYVRNCIFAGTDVGLRFKSGRGRGGLVENIFINDIQMRDIQDEAILFDLYYGEGEPETQAAGRSNKSTEPINDLTPRFQNIFIRNIVCNGANRAVLINGLPESPVKNIFIKNVDITSKMGILCIDADSIGFTNAYIFQEKGAVVSVNSSQNIFLDGFKYKQGAEIFLNVAGEKTANIRVENVDLSGAKKDVEFGEGARREAVVRK